ncbi:Hypothetical predicted protein [Mytilus galloprovincialis]|uniref:GST C-terminal domain-containing protein n=1 Tax=Mytilus galloprovincialis TaxID=29158 RepID=A0A8B6EQE4_MYTGA|nr:Hypothetical predicted protein [Mytilus galloprovincialis]
MEKTMCDVVLECINDVIKETLKLFLEQDETKKLSVADLAFFDLMNRLTAKKGDSIFDSSPTMKKHSEKITSIAGVQKWLEKRPVTDM